MQNRIDRQRRIVPELGGGSPHDTFCCKTVGDPKIAGDLLKHYSCEPAIAKYVNLKVLDPQETRKLTKELKKLFLDIAFIAPFQDNSKKSKFLFIFEHKSRPSRFVPIQGGTYAFLTLYRELVSDKQPAPNKKYVPSIPIMVLIYCGDEDIDGVIRFQDIYPKGEIPDDLKRFVPQFEMLVINFRKFDYGNLPGDPETQSVVESMKRAFDGTFTKNLGHIVGRLTQQGLDTRISELITDIVRYCAWVEGLTEKQVETTITTVIKGERGRQMARTVLKGVIKTGYESGLSRGQIIGEARGESKGETVKAQEIARNLKKMGFKTPDIVKATGLPIKVVNKLD
ncbi:MAG: Rpn family recombination-promoting nuclease/putative transposase [Planctomycetaceae bacterium]|jgi:hypothetical protein|nr:Rpn family recombination-promoting nuclease/putative transposase [Planctomycetaceae bacterium]